MSRCSVQLSPSLGPAAASLLSVHFSPGSCCGDSGHTGVSEEGVVFLEVGPVGPMRQFGEHARQLFG